MTTLRRLRQVTALVFRVDPPRAVIAMVCLVLTSVAGGAISVAVKYLVDAAVDGDRSAATWAAVVVAVAQGTIQILGNVQANLQNMLGQEVSAHIDRDVLRAVTQVPTVEHFERPDYLDRVSLVVGKGDDMAAATWAAAGAAGLALRVVVAVWVLVTVDPALAVLPLFAVPALLATRKNQQIVQQVEERVAQSQRLSHSLHNLFLDPGPAKELRVFTVEDTLSRRSDELWRDIARQRMRADTTATLWSMAGWAPFFLAFGAGLVVVGLGALNGHGTPGEAALVVQLALQIRSQVTMASFTVQDVTKAFTAMDRLGWLQDYTTAATSAATASSPAAPASPVPNPLLEGIRLDAVTFRYPGTDTKVLRGIDLELPAGSSLAVVGDNGAGKTTLIKLLCGYYRPTAGRITIDGTPLEDLDPAAWRANVAGAFQDYVKLEALLRVSVGAGDLARAGDDTALLDALERAAAADIPNAWPEHLDTHVGKSYRAGVEPSGGQWQKIAVGRAMMRTPLLLILDEPTSALDAATEDELFRRYTQAAAARRANGAITILISHRFSTVRAAERIIVLTDGVITESGTHDELMTAAGRYAEMFRFQSTAYHG